MNPSIWIKNSEMQKKGIIKDKEANFLVNGYQEEIIDDDEGKEQDGPSTSLNDERVIKMNQNAIENYKKYIESVKEIRKGTLDDCYMPVPQS
jgi:hypothetical protein